MYSFVIEVVIISWLCSREYLQLYVAIQQYLSAKKWLSLRRNSYLKPYYNCEQTNWRILVDLKVCWHTSGPKDTHCLYWTNIWVNRHHSCKCVGHVTSDTTHLLHYKMRGCPRGVMVKVMDCGIVVSEFVLQSRYYVHFRANTLGKGIEPPYPPSYGLNITTTVLLGEWLWH